MTVITIHHAKTNLSRLIKKASAAEEVITPVATSQLPVWSHLERLKANASLIRSKASCMSERNSFHCCHLMN